MAQNTRICVLMVFLSFFIFGFSLPASALTGYYVLTVPSVRDGGWWQLGTVVAEVPTDALQGGDAVIFSLPHGFKFGPDNSSISDQILNDALRKVDNTGKVTFESSQSIVALTVDQVNRLAAKARPVEMILPGVRLTLPVEVINAATPLANLEKLEVRVDQLDDATSSNLAHGAKNAGQFKIVGKIVELSLLSTTRDGSKSFITKFTAPVKIALPVPVEKHSLMKDSRLVVGKYDDAGQAWEPLPTTYENGQAVAGTNTFSKYTLLEKVVPAKAFTDIAGHWAQKDIEFMADRGLVAGVGDGKFDPDRPVTRAEFVSLLVRSLGLEGTGAPMPFRDVPQHSWYRNDIGIAVSSGIVHGFSNESFGPEEPVTREQMAVMIANVQSQMSKTLQADGNISLKFTDEDQISAWAKGYVISIARGGIVKGLQVKNGVAFMPKGNATRAQATVTVLRVLEFNQIKWQWALINQCLQTSIQL